MQELSAFERERALELTENAKRQSPTDPTNKRDIPLGRTFPILWCTEETLICTVFVEYTGNATGHPARSLRRRPRQSS